MSLLTKLAIVIVAIVRATSAQAELITISFGGSVFNTNDHGTGLLDSSVSIGTGLSGSYTFDSLALGTFISPGLIVYRQHLSSGALFDLSVGNYSLNILDGFYDIQIENDLGSAGNNDKYSVESAVGAISFSNGTDIFSSVGFSMDLRDFADGDALTSVSLPLSVDLGLYGGPNNILITFNDGFGGSVDISAQISSIEVTSVPEPGTLTLFAIGLTGIVLTRHRRLALARTNQ